MDKDTTIQPKILTQKELFNNIKGLARDEEGKSEIEKNIQRCKVDPTKKVLLPPVILSFTSEDGNSSILCTQGNFSLITGKAKSRKTFLVTAMAAAAINGGSGKTGFVGTLQDGLTVLLFDTEQAEYHVQKTTQRICNLVGNNNPGNFEAYRLRPLTPKERIEVIEHVIQNTPNLGLVIIDGLRDLLSKGINDETDATSVVSKILKWTHERKIHVLLVLHQNKVDNNVRGHIGTEVINKAETVLSVQKYAKNPEISTVTPEYCRNIDFEPFSFQINNEGLPELVTLSESKTSLHDTIRDNFNHILSDNRTLPYTKLVKEYISVSGRRDRTAREHISIALKEGILVRGINNQYQLNSRSMDENTSS